MSNNLYNILAAFNNATKPAEVETPKQQAQKIYESVEAKGSIMGGVKGVEKKLSEAFAKHKSEKSKIDFDHYRKQDAAKDKAVKQADKDKKTTEKFKSDKKVKEGKMSDLDYELKAKEVSDADFKKKYVKSKADMRKSMSGKKDEKKPVKETKRDPDTTPSEWDDGDLDEGAGDDIQWYDRPDEGPETLDTDTGRVHKAGKGGYGNKYDDDVPSALPAGQVARGRGRPKGLPALLRAQKAAELAAKGIDPNAPRGRGRPRAQPAAGEENSAPQGTLGLHRFLFGPAPTKLPGKPGVKHKIADVGTEKGRVAAVKQEGLGDDFANMARNMKNKDGTPRFTTVRQGPAPIKPPSSKPPGAVRPSGPAATGPADWYNQSTGGKRNMGDSKINRKAAVSEGARPTNFKGYLTEAAGGQDAFEHILNRFKHEVKQFQAGGDMDNDLYEALFDYYLNAGEMPYGVAKARTGDPYEWVCQRFDQEHPAMDEAVDPLTVPAVQRKAAGQAPLSLDQVRAPRADSISDPVNLARNNGTKDLDDLARLAGITTESVSVIGGDMSAEECEDDSKMNISTNQSSDGTKSITVTADGEAAVALLDMLKNAGMGGSDAAAEQEVIIAAQGDENMGDSGAEEMEEEYENEPAPQYQSVEKITSAGDDMNRQKRQNFPMRQPGNNPMAGDEQVNELSKNTLGSYAKKANDQRAHEPDDMKADRRGTGVMKAIGKIAGGPNKGGLMRGHAAQARFTNANNLPNAAKDAETFNRSVDRNVAKESADPVQSMGRDLMAEYQAMKIKK